MTTALVLHAASVAKCVGGSYETSHPRLHDNTTANPRMGGQPPTRYDGNTKIRGALLCGALQWAPQVQTMQHCANRRCCLQYNGLYHQPNPKCSNTGCRVHERYTMFRLGGSQRPCCVKAAHCCSAS